MRMSHRHKHEIRRELNQNRHFFDGFVSVFITDKA